MEESYSIQRLLVLRRLTVAVSKLLTDQLRDYLTTLSPLLRPGVVLGDFVDSGTKETVRSGAERNFKELQGLYETVATAKPFNLTPGLKPPVEIVSTSIEFTPYEYSYTAQSEGGGKVITVTKPLTWVLNYSGYTIGRLRGLLADRNRSAGELREVVLHFLILHAILSRQRGVTQILETLHFPVSHELMPEFGQLPVAFVKSSVSTLLPADGVILESTEISGRNFFQEIIRPDDIVKMKDPLRKRLIEVVNSYDPDMASA